MRWLVMVAAATVAMPHVAHARHLWDEPDGPAYPDELVDRPLVLLDGMTRLDAVVAVHDHDVPRLVADTPDLSVEHSFGPVSIDASFGPGASFAMAFPTGRFPDAIVIGASTSAPAPDKTMFVSQYLTAEHKLVAVPHEIAFVVAAGGAYFEEHIHAPGLQWARVVGVDVSASLEIQLASTLAVYGGAAITYPITASNDLAFEAAFNARAGVSLTIAKSWDVFTTGTLSDDHATALLGLAAGVAKRFGP